MFRRLAPSPSSASAFGTHCLATGKIDHANVADTGNRGKCDCDATGVMRAGAGVMMHAARPCMTNDARNQGPRPVCHPAGGAFAAGVPLRTGRITPRHVMTISDPVHLPAGQAAHAARPAVAATADRKGCRAAAGQARRRGWRCQPALRGRVAPARPPARLRRWPGMRHRRARPMPGPGLRALLLPPRRCRLPALPGPLQAATAAPLEGV